jgi:HlyD family secretion protein
MGMENAENRPSVPGPDQNKGENNAMKIVWVKSGDSIKPRMVEVGETDEINYEVITGINEGEEVITSLQSNSGAIKVENERASSPFMPKPPGQNRKK